MITSAALWALWKLRNEMCFQNRAWRNMGRLLMRVVSLIQNWIILCPEGRREELKTYSMQLMLSGKKARNPGKPVDCNEALCMKIWLTEVRELEKL
jgi:hypothetical protein